MCGECPTSKVGEDTTNVRTAMDGVLSILETGIHKQMAQCDNIEDMYREAGQFYYWSSMHLSGHMSDFLTAEELLQLKEHFVIKTIEEYKALFEPVDSLVKRLAELQSEILSAKRIVSKDDRFRLDGTLEACHHRLDKDILPSYRKLVGEVNAVYTLFQTVRDHASALSTAALDRQLPQDTADQWAIFYEWVGSLPDAHRMISAGLRPVQDIATTMLCESDREVVEGEEYLEDDDDETLSAYSRDSLDSIS